MAEADFAAVFAALRERMLRAAPDCDVVTDVPGSVVLHARIPNPLKPKEKMWFGAVRVGKAYVGYHLMPVYSHPALAAQVGPALKKRMQGLSCFNFKTADPDLFDELERLTAAGAALYSRPIEITRRPGQRS